MSGTIRRAKLTRSDLAHWDGKTATYSRVDASGGTIAGLVVNDLVDIVQVFGSGANFTRATISTALQFIGTNTVTLLFAAGTWTIDNNLTIPSNFTCKVPAGCIFNVSSGKTLTFSGKVFVEYPGSWTTGSGTVTVTNGVLNETNFVQTAAELSASVTPTNTFVQPYNVQRQNAKGDGSTSDTTAFTQTISAAAGRKVIVQSQSSANRFPGVLTTSGNIHLEGEGASTGRVKARMEFAASPGASGAQWDFTGATSYVNLRDIQVGHATEPPASTSQGIGLSFVNAPFGRWDNLWVSSFNVGINITGQFFYSGMRDVVSDKNYTANLQVSGNLWNGAYILGGQFSHSVNGYGIDFQSIGSHASLYSVYREGNHLTGIHNGGAHVINEIGPYFEQNSSAASSAADIYNDITFPHWTAKYTLIGGYFNGSATSGKALCRSTLTGWFAANNKFFNEAGLAPFLLADSGGYDRGINGSVFIGNEYTSQYLTDFGINEDARMNFFDSKHPQVRWSNGVPASCLMHVGMYFFNKNTTLPFIRGWRCTVPGRVATIPTITTKATTSAGSKIIAIDVSNNTELLTGEYIQVAGETFGGDAFCQILACNSNGTVTVDKNAGVGVAAAAITYKTASVVTDAHEGISGDQGDANRAYTIGVDFPTYLFATALTANRTLTLNATNAYNGARFRVVRTGLGAFTLDFGGLKTLPAGTAAYAEAQHDGTNWKLIAYGTL